MGFVFGDERGIFGVSSRRVLEEILIRQRLHGRADPHEFLPAGVTPERHDNLFGVFPGGGRRGGALYVGTNELPVSGTPCRQLKKESVGCMDREEIQRDREIRAQSR